MNKENIPESEMDEIDHFIAQVDNLFERLDPPSPLMSDDPVGTWQEYIMKNRILLCFPNLNRKERRIILDAYFEAHYVTVFSVDEPEMIAKYGPGYRESFLAAGKRNYEKGLRRIARYELRAKLSSFQERLLDRFIEICPAVQW